MKKFANGTYRATITSVTNGVSELKKTPYYLVKFESSDRYIEERIYMSGSYLKFIKFLHFKAGVYSNNYDCSVLIGAQIGIEVVSGSRCRDNGSIVTYPEIKSFLTLDELDQLINYYDYEEEGCMDNNGYAEIYGVDLDEMAADMDIDRSDIYPGMIMEYAGY